MNVGIDPHRRGCRRGEAYSSHNIDRGGRRFRCGLGLFGQILFFFAQRVLIPSGTRVSFIALTPPPYRMCCCVYLLVSMRHPRGFMSPLSLSLCTSLSLPSLLSTAAPVNICGMNFSPSPLFPKRGAVYAQQATATLMRGTEEAEYNRTSNITIMCMCLCDLLRCAGILNDDGLLVSFLFSSPRGSSH